MEEKKQEKLYRIVEKSYNLIKNWESNEDKKEVIDMMTLFLNSLAKEDPFFYAKGLLEKLSFSVTLPQFKVFLVPFERELSRLQYALKFSVSHQDSIEKKEPEKSSLYFILDNIRSAYNVGSILRLSECLGVKEVIFTGYTPREDHPKVKKTSMNVEDFVKTRYFENAFEAISFLKKKGVFIAALETEESAQNLYDFSCGSSEIALLVGNERHGISYDLLKECDALIKIPVWGVKNSLNVTSALSVSSYEIKRKVSP